MKIICTSCAHYCTTCGTCGVFHIGVTGMNVAPCRYYKPNDKPELPEEFRTIIALIKFDDMPPMPVTGYMADVDTDAAYTADTEVIIDGYFHESEFRSAPYFDLKIDGISLLDTAF